MSQSAPGSTSKTTMNCPICSVALVMSERQSIEIDYCPQCRGVWLDRGELDKIIEYSFQQYAPVQDNVEYAGETANYGNEGGYREQGGYRDDHNRGSKHGGKHGGKRGRRGENKLEWLKDLFD